MDALQAKFEVDREARRAAMLAARQVIATHRNPRTAAHRWTPSGLALHVALAAVYAYQQAGGGPVGRSWAGFGARRAVR